MNPPLSRKEELRQRRLQLRQQRRGRALKICWQVLVLGAIVSGILWAVQQPDWVIRQSQQIQIRGNRYLAANTVREMLGLKYPVSLLHIEPQSLNNKLLDQGSILAANIHRELLPPRITIQIQDQPPVAVADQADQPGLVNATGTWLPLSSYQIDNDKLPRLRILTASNGLCPNWSIFYQAIRSSPIPISEIDCRDTLNLLLTTDIGDIRIGSFEPTRLRQQLQKAYELGDWKKLYQQKYNQTSDIDYIDLENPDMPKIQQSISNTNKKTEPKADDQNTKIDDLPP
jgi:cell division protein FtsQ